MRSSESYFAALLSPGAPLKRPSAAFRLVPKPSASPLDPLNWSTMWKGEWIIRNICRQRLSCQHPRFTSHCGHHPVLVLLCQCHVRTVFVAHVTPRRSRVRRQPNSAGTADRCMCPHTGLLQLYNRSILQHLWSTRYFLNLCTVDHWLHYLASHGAVLQQSSGCSCFERLRHRHYRSFDDAGGCRHVFPSRARVLDGCLLVSNVGRRPKRVCTDLAYTYSSSYFMGLFIGPVISGNISVK